MACKDYKYRVGGPGQCKIGWVLKTGTLGLGYYKDGVPEKRAIQLNDLLWPSQNLAPVVICLDEVVRHREVIGNPLTASTDEQPPAVAKKRSKSSTQCDITKRGSDKANKTASNGKTAPGLPRPKRRLSTSLMPPW